MIDLIGWSAAFLPVIMPALRKALVALLGAPGRTSLGSHQAVHDTVFEAAGIFKVRRDLD